MYKEYIQARSGKSQFALVFYSLCTLKISSSTEVIFSMRHFHVNNRHSLTTLNLSIHHLLFLLRGLTSIWLFLSLASLAYGMTFDHYFLTSNFLSTVILK